MSLVLITLQATYRDGATSFAAAGQVTITPKEWRASPTDNRIYAPEPYAAVLDDNGGMVAVLVNRDDPADRPYVYAVSEKLGNVTRDYEITLPVADDGSVIDLADVQPDGTWQSADIVPGGFGGF